MRVGHLRLDALTSHPVMKLMVGQVSAQVIAVAALPLLTRLYGPAEFGGYTLAIGIGAMLTFMATLGLAGYTATIESQLSAFRFTRAMLTTTLGVGSMAFALALMARLLPGVSNQAAVHLAAAAFVGLGSGWFLVTRALCNRLGAHDRASLAQVARAVGFVLAACLLALLVPSSLGGVKLALAMPLADLLVVTWLISVLPGRQRRVLTAYSLRRTISEVRRYQALIVAGGLSHFLSALMQSAPPLFVGVVYGPAAAGWFGLAQRIVVLPTTVLAGSVGTYLSVSLSKSWHQGADISGAIRLIVVCLGALSVVGFGFLALVAPPLLPVLFGTEWAGGGAVVTVMALLGAPLLITSAISFLPLLTGKYRHLLAWMSLRAVSLSVLSVWAWLSSFTLIDFLVAYAAVEGGFFVLFTLFFVGPSKWVKPA
jgi:O-antigen/teichoic acid export membrane protein